jgi:hypothetical protein
MERELREKSYDGKLFMFALPPERTSRLHRLGQRLILVREFSGLRFCFPVHFIVERNASCLSTLRSLLVGRNERQIRIPQNL